MSSFPFTSTKTYNQAFPVAYRQWRADSHCNKIHGYALSIHLEFGAIDLDARNWVVDYGGLRPLKDLLENWFDHTLLVAQDDPDRETLLKLGSLAKITEVERTGCEGLADFVFNYINSCWLKDYGYAGRVLCTCVQVRETDANMAMRNLTALDFFIDHAGRPVFVEQEKK
jgi:6-pyruvoyltetrahydropterin/6-carboxytetrahydropterin synthase